MLQQMFSVLLQQNKRAGTVGFPLVFCISFVQLIIYKELEGKDEASCHTKTLASASAPALAI